MFGRRKKLAVALMCSDWRLHQREVGLHKQISRALRVSRVDINAVPGPDGLLLPERAAEWEAVTGWVKFLADAHNASALAVVAHERCAGHPVSDRAHEADAIDTARALKDALDFDGRVAALIARYHSDSKWTIETLDWIKTPRAAIATLPRRRIFAPAHARFGRSSAAE